MKSITSVLAIIILLLSIQSCQSPQEKQTKADPLYQQIMDIHDDVMPKLSKIHKLKKQLKKSVEAESTEVQRLILNLDTADEGMMSWMAAFKPDMDTKVRKKYLQSQLISVVKMAKDINRSITEADAYLAK